MSRAGQFGISFLVHALIVLFLFSGFMGLISLIGLRWQIPLVVSVLLVGAVGFWKRAKWGREHQAYFVAGLVLAVTLLTAAFHIVTWVLAHPVGAARSFTTYLRYATDDAEEIAITLGPMVLLLSASLVGYSLGKRSRR